MTGVQTCALPICLGSRKFLLNNVREDAPVVFESRWVMSYLRGPLTRDQIKTLMAGRQSAPAATQTAAPAAGNLPALPPGIKQFFLPSDGTLRPKLVGAAKVRFADSKSGVEETRDVVLAAEIPAGLGGVDWAGAESPDASPGDFTTAAPADGAFAELPGAASVAKNFPAWEKEFVRWLADNQKCEVLKCPALSINSTPGESRADFTARASLAQREFRDEKVSGLRTKFTPKLAAIEARIARAEAAVQKQKDQARNANVQTAISVGTTILGALFGRKAFSASTISKAGTAARGASRAMREGADVAQAEESVESLQAERARLEGDFAAESASLSASLQEPAIESFALKPSRGGITVQLFGLGWI